MRIIYITILILIFACGTNKSSKSESSIEISENTINTVKLYKTNKDYSKLVPIRLSSDKKKIIGYPHPKDVLNDSSFNYPTQLYNGYWKDNIGIDTNTFYLDITLEKYSKLTTPPPIEVMMSKLIETNPFMEIWINKKGIDLSESELNGIILMGNLERYFYRVK